MRKIEVHKTLIPPDVQFSQEEIDDGVMKIISLAIPKIYRELRPFVSAIHFDTLKKDLFLSKRFCIYTYASPRYFFVSDYIIVSSYNISNLTKLTPSP